jgi:hypothetical protein
MLDVDLTAEFPQAPHEAADGLGLVVAREVIGAEVAVRHAVAEHVAAGAEHGGRDGERVQLLNGLCAPSALPTSMPPPCPILPPTPVRLHPAGSAPPMVNY